MEARRRAKVQVVLCIKVINSILFMVTISIDACTAIVLIKKSENDTNGE